MTKKKSAAASVPPVKMVRANINRVVVPSATFVTLYANDVTVIVTPWDFLLRFGLIQMPDENGPVAVQQFGDLRLSPQFAKQFARVLLDQIRVYEESVGSPIPVPPD